MPNKVTDLTVAQALKDDARVLITQEETADGETKERLRRVPTETVFDLLRDEYTSIYGQRLSVTWERGNINSDGSAPVVGNSTKWMRTADFISAEYRLALAFANNPRPLLAQVFFYSSASVAGYIGKTPSQNSHFLIEPPEGTTHIKVALTTSDYDTTDGITGEMFQEYKKRIWLTYALRSLLKKITDMVDLKADADMAQALENKVRGLLGNKTTLTLVSGYYCDPSDGTKIEHSGRAMTEFIPYDENLVIANTTYAGSGVYIQGFVTLYSAVEDDEGIYIKRISTDLPQWVNLATNYLNLRDYAWYKPKYFRISFRYSDVRTLNEERIGYIADNVYLLNQASGQLAEIARKQSGTDLLYEATGLDPLTSNLSVSIAVQPGSRPVLISIDANYTLAAGMAVTPVNAELYATCADTVATDVLNNSPVKVDGAYQLTTYYLTTGEEINCRLEVSETAGGTAIGWISHLHAKLPKVNPQYYSSIRSDSGYLMVYGSRYIVGENAVIKRQQLRMPAPQAGTTCLRLSFVVPTGCTLNISSIRVCYDEPAKPVEAGIRFDAHGAFYYFPEHTRKAFELEAACGATSLITIPKRSADGVWFCFHDDTFPGSHNYFRNADGTTITEDDNIGKAFNQIDFADLKDYRIRRDGWSALERVFLLSDFFTFCAKMGIKPVLSFHPLYTTTGYTITINGETRSVREYARDAVEIKALAERCGVLDKLGIKVDSGATTLWRVDPREVPLELLYDIFGNEIDSYIVTQGQNQTESVSSIITAFNALRNAATPLSVDATIEIYGHKATVSDVDAITGAGYRASIFQPVSTYMAIDGDERSLFHSNDLEYWISHGVTRFGTNKIASFGLNW